MLKSQPNQTAPNAKDVQQAASQSDSDLEQQQARHRTAVRIAGIEGIEGFADVAEKADETDARPGS